MDPINSFSLLFIFFVVTSFFWGHDSRYGINSPEWEQRNQRGGIW